MAFRQRSACSLEVTGKPRFFVVENYFFNKILKSQVKCVLSLFNIIIIYCHNYPFNGRKCNGTVSEVAKIVKILNECGPLPIANEVLSSYRYMYLFLWLTLNNFLV